MIQTTEFQFVLTNYNIEVAAADAVSSLSSYVVNGTFSADLIGVSDKLTNTVLTSTVTQVPYYAVLI